MSKMMATAVLSRMMEAAARHELSVQAHLLVLMKQQVRFCLGLQQQFRFCLGWLLHHAVEKLRDRYDELQLNAL